MEEFFQHLYDFCSKNIVVLGVCAALGVGATILEKSSKITTPIQTIINKRKDKKEAERKKDQLIADMSKTLADVKKTFDDFNAHYSLDNISKRDSWIDWVNNQAVVYDTSIAELKKTIEENNKITLMLLIDSKRNSIIDFASKVIDENYPVTKEQFNRIYKIYAEYEKIIEDNNLTNGEVNVAHKIINKSYEKHMANHSFVEDKLDY